MRVRGSASPAGSGRAKMRVISDLRNIAGLGWSSDHVRSGGIIDTHDPTSPKLSKLVRSEVSSACYRLPMQAEKQLCDPLEKQDYPMQSGDGRVLRGPIECLKLFHPSQSLRMTDFVDCCLSDRLQEG